MKQQWCLVVIATLGLALAAPAQAEPAAPMRAGMMSSDEVLAMVRSTGLSPLERPARRGTIYTLRAGTPEGKPMRVVVDGRAGQIVSVAPIGDPRLAPGPGVTMGPYEPIRPGPGVRQLGPPVVYDPDPPIIYGARPPAPVPDTDRDLAPGPRLIGPPRGAPSVPPRAAEPAAPVPPGSVPPVASTRPEVVAPPADATPRSAMPEPGNGLLPPPPERFPQRAAPPPEPRPKPAARAAAPPREPPLPRPRPTTAAAQPAAPAPAAPAPVAPESKPEPPPELPH